MLYQFDLETESGQTLGCGTYALADDLAVDSQARTIAAELLGKGEARESWQMVVSHEGGWLAAVLPLNELQVAH